jgi:G3E family GTPase
LKSVELLNERYTDQEIDDADNRSVANLLIDQIEFANVIIINKIDLVDEKQANQIRALVTKLNPEANILMSTRSKIDLKQILNTKSFSFDRAVLHPGWLKELRGEVRVSKTLKKIVSIQSLKPLFFSVSCSTLQRLSNMALHLSCTAETNLSIRSSFTGAVFIGVFSTS